jgi:signal transduction histidine kinase
MIVHDLRSPLTGVVTALHFLRQDAFDGMSDGSKQDLEQALRNSGRLIGMINDLLDINRIESNQLPISRERTTVSELVDSSLDLVGRLRASNVLLNQPEEPVFLVCDTHLTERVLCNLIDNALKYSSTEPARVDIEADEEHVKIYVRDRGPGIPREAYELIFQKFGQLEARRTHGLASSGLGLAFCKMAVEAQGGSIGLESEVGTGSSFWIRFPRKALQQAD